MSAGRSWLRQECHDSSSPKPSTWPGTAESAHLGCWHGWAPGFLSVRSQELSPCGLSLRPARPLDMVVHGSPREHRWELPGLFLSHSLNPSTNPDAPAAWGVSPGSLRSLGHLWILLASKETKSLLLLLQTSLQEPEEKKIVQELLETEQAYVARLHLLDQASGQGAPPPHSLAPGCPPTYPALLSGPPHKS